MIDKKKYDELRQVHKLKYREVKRNFKKAKPIPEIQRREAGLCFGSVWGIADKSVPFDYKRKPEHIKATLRPCLVLITPESFDDFSVVYISPGTTVPHHSSSINTTYLKADVPPEELDRTIYFLLGDYCWYSIQKNIKKKICELSSGLKKTLTEKTNIIEK